MRQPRTDELVQAESDPELGEFERAHTAPRKIIAAASMLGWSAGLAGFSGLQLLGITFRMRALNAAPFILFAIAAAPIHADDSHLGNALGTGGNRAILLSILAG